MITQQQVNSILQRYDTKKITIASLGGHSALDVCRGAKKHGFRTLVVCQKGREETYTQFYKTRTVNGQSLGCVDEVIVLDKFADITKPEVVKQLQQKNAIFIHNRYFWVYVNFKEVEEQFMVPIFGSRFMLKLEERDVPKNQYYLLQKAGIRMPTIFSDPKKIDRLVIVKVNEKERGYERAFFYASSHDDYQKKAKQRIKEGIFDEAMLKKAVIEEFIVGAQVNFNYFYSPLTGELELMGTDMRRQTNLDGLIRLPATEQIEILQHLKPTLVETGHVAVTTKESLIGPIFAMGQKFVNATKNETGVPIIGPFALQGAIASEKGKEAPIIFDVSLRIPGSPGTMFTPYTAYLYGDPISYGERIALEIKQAVKEKRLKDVCT